MELTISERKNAYCVAKICTSVERINAAREYIRTHPGIIGATQEWADYLCLRIDTIDSLIHSMQD